MNLYTIHSGDECDGDPRYSVLKGPDGFECWLTEPEDRSWYRDGNEVVQLLEKLTVERNTLQARCTRMEEALKGALKKIDQQCAWRKADEEMMKHLTVAPLSHEQIDGIGRHLNARCENNCGTEARRLLQYALTPQAPQKEEM